MEFIKAFNERTASQSGYVVPAEITVFEDRSFTFVTKAPLAAALDALGAQAAAQRSAADRARAIGDGRSRVVRPLA